MKSFKSSYISLKACKFKAHWDKVGGDILQQFHNFTYIPGRGSLLTTVKFCQIRQVHAWQTAVSISFSHTIIKGQRFQMYRLIYCCISSYLSEVYKIDVQGESMYRHVIVRHYHNLVVCIQNTIPSLELSFPLVGPYGFPVSLDLYRNCAEPSQTYVT